MLHYSLIRKTNKLQIYTENHSSLSLIDHQRHVSGQRHEKTADETCTEKQWQEIQTVLRQHLVSWEGAEGGICLKGRGEPRGLGRRTAGVREHFLPSSAQCCGQSILTPGLAPDEGVQWSLEGHGIALDMHGGGQGARQREASGQYLYTLAREIFYITYINFIFPNQSILHFASACKLAWTYC